MLLICQEQKLEPVNFNADICHCNSSHLVELDA